MSGSPSRSPSSSCHPAWISPTTVIFNSPHQRRRHRLVTAALIAPSPVAPAALTPVQEQSRSHRRRQCNHCLSSRHSRQRTFPTIPRTHPRLASAHPHTNTHTTSTPSLPAKNRRGRSSSITSSGCTPAPVSPRPAPSLP